MIRRFDNFLNEAGPSKADQAGDIHEAAKKLGQKLGIVVDTGFEYETENVAYVAEEIARCIKKGARFLYIVKNSSEDGLTAMIGATKRITKNDCIKYLKLSDPENFSGEDNDSYDIADYTEVKL